MTSLLIIEETTYTLTEEGCQHILLEYMRSRVKLKKEKRGHNKSQFYLFTKSFLD